jgi:hypothetical protein
MALPEAKTDFAWKNRDTLLVGTDFGPGSSTDSGYPRITKEWKRGTALEAAIVVYEGEKGDVAVAATSDRTPGFERDLVTRGITFWESEVFLREHGALIIGSESGRPLLCAGCLHAVRGIDLIQTEIGCHPSCSSTHLHTHLSLTFSRIGVLLRDRTQKLRMGR